jgi:hypothetical protein
MIGLRHMAVLLLALAVAACATPRTLQDLYVPLGPNSFGYAEQPAGDRRFQISYVAPLQTGFSYAGPSGRQEADADVARAFDLALLRTADVAAANGATAFRVVDRVNDVNVRSYPSYRDPFWYPGWRRPFYPYPYAWPYGPFYDESYATLAVRVTLTVELLPVVEAGAYDVQNVQATIRGRYAMPQS